SGAIVTTSTQNAAAATQARFGTSSTSGALNLVGETILFQNSSGNTSNATVMSSPITGSGSLVVSGAGNLYMDNTYSTYSGGTVVNAAPFININNNTNFGAGTLTIIGGTFDGNNVALANASNFNGYFAISSANLTFNGPTTLTGNTQLLVGNNVT